MSAKIRTLIVDDSRLMRDMISTMLSSDPAIEVVGTAEDPFDAREKIKALNPDVMTLDINMPKMDGIEFLKKVMRLRPMPVVMFSTLTQDGADATLRALEVGAFDYAAKPTEDIRQHFDRLTETLVSKVKSAAAANLAQRTSATLSSARASNKSAKSLLAGCRLLVVGASTGGVEALRSLAGSISASTRPIAIVQHMPENFTAQFARRLSAICAAEVKEAADGEVMRDGFVYVAPGHSHLTLRKTGQSISCALEQSPKVSGHRPAVDKLFMSAAEVVGQSAGGIILTGMGRDGAEGLKALHDTGAVTIGQSEASSLVYGMPKAASELGAVKHDLSLEEIGMHISGCAGDRKTFVTNDTVPTAKAG